MVIETLTENGLTAVGVGSAANMDAILKTQSFDLIVLDVMLPGENGFSICRRLRALSTIPIVMLTALEDEINRVVGIELGADDLASSRSILARPYI
ncbi:MULTISPECIES: response regulator [Rhizobium/Agrobacterium group]